jgi:hypothetical protein
MIEFAPEGLPMSRILFLALLTVFLAVPSLSPAAGDGKHMKAALELLQSAKKSDSPRPMLVAAKRHLSNVKPNKEGALAQARKSLNEAIALAELGKEKDKLEQKINATIANVHNAMGNAG